jgi:uncharacterized protein (TIGR01777 family)
VLSKNGGALVPLLKPLKFGIAPTLGSGRQYMSWIHIDDLCELIKFALENETISGTYNAVSPEPVRHRKFMQSLRKIFAPHAIQIPIPEFLLTLIMGEQKAVVLDSTRVSSKKIMDAGFNFKYNHIDQALEQIHEE